jgi:hypothetical protein
MNPGVYHGPDAEFDAGNADGSKGDLARGWAICAVPTFAFDTTSLISPDSNEMNFWINDSAAMASGGGVGRQGGGNQKFVDLYEEFFASSGAAENVEAAQVGPRGQTVWNFLQINWLFDSRNDPEYERITEWLDYGGHVPDMMHRCSCLPNGQVDTPTDNKPFIELDNSDVSAKRLALELFTRFPDGGWPTAGSLGSVMCGPYETLSLFKTWRYGSNTADFHPVVDYFTTADDRYPSRKEVAAKTGADGEVDWEALSGEGTSGDPYKDLYSAVHNGRANLNAPLLVATSKIANNKGVRGAPNGFLNPYPIAAVLNGAPYPASSQDGSMTTKQVSEDTALQLATDFCYTVEESDLAEMKATSSVFGFTRNVVRNISAFGQAVGSENKFLEHFVNMAKPKCDSEREGILNGVIDGFTTRGQTFLVVIRADAYSPKFGENDSVQDGTTLATTHALVELFRDPAPARAPDGSYPSDGSHPVSYHNWQIRSFRVF